MVAGSEDGVRIKVEEILNRALKKFGRTLLIYV
jgi:hypothetical protein